jgi:anti-sigma B factor antagonist
MSDINNGNGSFNTGLESKVVEMQGHKVLTVSGEIDAYSAPQFKLAVMNILDETDQHLIVDMHNIRYMDSSGFAILLSALKRLSPTGGSLHLIGCTPTINRLLEITKLSSIMALHQNMNDAMEALSA